ncbi:MAG: hypothetical protein WD380_12735 [Gaiellaceae bacterium]
MRASRRRALGVLGATVLAGLLVAVAGAVPTASYSDPAGDANEVPDITSVIVDDTTPGAVNLRVTVSNFQELPSDSRIILQFDLDRNASTGVAGDELVVRYWDDETLEVLRWDGIRLAASSADSLSASFASGILSFSAERAALGGSTAFALLVVSARTQQLEIGRVTSTDFAPASGRSTYVPPGQASFPDPQADHDAAPDITSISVSDTPAGMIRVRVTTPNYLTLPPDKIIGVDFDLEGRPPAADDVFVQHLSGAGIVQVDREENGILAPSELPNTASGVYENGVLTLSVHRSELDGAARVGIGVVSFDLVGDGESEGQDFEGDVEALDSAPDDLMGTLFPYRLANRPPLQLRAAETLRSPTRARAGNRFTYTVVVRRLDTYQVLRSGSVTCSVFVSGARVRATGQFVDGKAQCSLLVPARFASSTLRGTATIRAAGAVVRSTFRSVVR